MPYDVQLVAGNGAGCGEISRSQQFFTREGGKHKCVEQYFNCSPAPQFFLGIV